MAEFCHPMGSVSLQSAYLGRFPSLRLFFLDLRDLRGNVFFFHRLLKPSNRFAKVLAKGRESTRSKNEQDDAKYDDPVPNRKSSHGALLTSFFPYNADYGIREEPCAKMVMSIRLALMICVLKIMFKVDGVLVAL